MPDTQILIIGGGSSGLTAAGALKQYGLETVILDKGARIGDVWRERYDRLHLHTIRGLSYLAYHKMPDHFPRYVPRDQFAQYLEDYAHHFALDIRHRVEVIEISSIDDGRWRVVTTNQGEWQTEHLIIATGVNRVPYVPEWAGQETFTGGLFHAVNYKTGRDFVGKRVLVIGSGNTGTEICVDLIEQGVTDVDISIRTPPMIVPRDPFGIPIQGWAIPFAFMPGAVGDGVVNVLSRIVLGDLTRYGMEKPAWSVFADARIPTIDVGFADALKAGNVTVRPDIQTFTETGVTFVDGASGTYDVIIAATGYRTGLQKIFNLPDVIGEDGKVKAPSGVPTSHKGLWFIGLGRAPAGVLMASRIESRKLAKHIAIALGVIDAS